MATSSGAMRRTAALAGDCECSSCAAAAGAAPSVGSIGAGVSEAGVKVASELPGVGSGASVVDGAVDVSSDAAVALLADDSPAVGAAVSPFEHAAANAIADVSAAMAASVFAVFINSGSSCLSGVIPARGLLFYQSTTATASS
jgi:hypothetical protein